MDRAHAKRMLVALIVAVPLVVVAAGLTSFLMLRAGFGLVVGALLPFVVSLLVIAVLGGALGRAAGRPDRGRDDV